MRTFVLFLVFAFSAAHVQAAETFFLSTPCRVLDTRSLTSGFTAGLNFAVRGNPGGSQGGASGCGLPAQAEGAVLNVTAVSPATTGHAVLWAYGETQPGTSALNFSGSETTNDGLLVKLAGFGSTYDVSLGASTSSYWLVDLVGWVGQAATAPQRGVITNKEGGTTPPTIQLDLDGEVVPVVCAEPWIDPELCDFFDVTDCVAVTGHISPAYSVNKLYAHTITACP